MSGRNGKAVVEECDPCDGRRRCWSDHEDGLSGDAERSRVANQLTKWRPNRGVVEPS